MIGNIVQWTRSQADASKESKIVDSKILDKVLKNGATFYLVEDKDTGEIHLLNPEDIHVVNP